MGVLYACCVCAHVHQHVYIICVCVYSVRSAFVCVSSLMTAFMLLLDPFSMSRSAWALLQTVHNMCRVCKLQE